MFRLLLPVLAASTALAAPATTPPSYSSSSWPDTPFTASGRDILSASGQKVVYAGVNWPGAADTMLPEGLQYASIADIFGYIKDLGMNVIRLTYAIEMIDDYYEDSPNQTLKGTLEQALGSENGTKVLAQILSNNPQFTESTTRLEVFDAVAEEAANQQIWVHLDNHVSKAIWCCGSTDGNAWFGDAYFDVAKWQRGLGFMADHAKSWTAFASMSLRNELREPVNSTTAEDYDWYTWYQNVVPAATGIHGNNSDPLIFFSGLNYDTDDTALINGQDLGNGTYWKPSEFPFADKVVLEIHNYANSATNCTSLTESLKKNAYGAMDLDDSAYPVKAPVVMTEFGYDQTDGSSEGVYAQCIKSTVLGQPGGPGGWMQWELGGSYYIRTGTQDLEETWGLLNHDWSAWRNQTVIDEYVKPFVAGTL